MKAKLLTFAIAAGIGTIVSGQLLIFPEVAPDNAEARFNLKSEPQVASIMREYQRYLDERIGGLELSEITNSIGSAMPQPPTNLAYSLAMSPVVVLPGLRDDTRRTNIFQVGTIGYLQVFFGHDGKLVEAAVLYLRRDSDFVPFTSAGDFEKRLAWEKPRLSALRNWLDDHLIKGIDLGVVDFTVTNQVSLRLPNGSNYLVTLLPGLLKETGQVGDYLSFQLEQTISPELERELIEFTNRYRNLFNSTNQPADFMERVQELAREEADLQAKQGITYETIHGDGLMQVNLGGKTYRITPRLRK